MIYDQFGYLGTALKSPLDLKRGRVTLVSGTETVRQAIERLISTPKGSIFFNRQYGCRIEEMLFEPNNDIASEMIRFYIYEAIRDFEPRVAFVDIQTTIDDNRIDCIIKYRILATNEIQSFIYPFYRNLNFQ